MAHNAKPRRLALAGLSAFWATGVGKSTIYTKMQGDWAPQLQEGAGK